VYFYLEDDSVHVSEPKTPDSGIPQGEILMLMEFNPFI
jgi:hypothetical protein